MFTSPSPVVFMLCGHGIHRGCYDKHMKSSYKCPLCSKSTVNMETQFRNLDRAIDAQPMPPQFRDTKAMVSCNDCYAKSAVQYHWLGLKCAICDSYNTAQLSILSDPAVEVPVMESREAETTLPADHPIGDTVSPTILSAGPVRHRRHSLHIHRTLTSASAGESYRFAPYSRPARNGRSLSPVRGLGFFNDLVLPQPIESDDSADEDEMDFWGGEEPRSVTSFENVDEMEDEEDSDEDSAMDDCDDDADDDDEEDEFELLGHR